MNGKLTFVFIGLLIAYVYSASVSRQKRQVGDFLLPDGAELLLSKAIDTSFVCSAEGYYADLNNNCEIFHICHITDRADGSGADLRQYSFVCPNTTIFNQFSMTCDYPEFSLPCASAPDFFYLNERIGQDTARLHEDADVEKLASYLLPKET